MGGNVFKNFDGSTVTTSIKCADVKSTLNHLLINVLKATGVNSYETLGSAGKTARSGDIDIAVPIDRDNQVTFRRAFARKVGQILGSNRVKNVGQLVSIRYPIVTSSGAVLKEDVQIDVMFTDSLSNTTWMMSGADDNHVKGVYRNLMLSHIAKQISQVHQAAGDNIKMSIAFPSGLEITRDNKIIHLRTNKPTEILHLLGFRTSTNNVGTFEDLVDYMIHDDEMMHYLTSYKRYIKPYLQRDPTNACKAITYINCVTQEHGPPSAVISTMFKG